MNSNDNDPHKSKSIPRSQNKSQNPKEITETAQMISKISMNPKIQVNPKISYESKNPVLIPKSKQIPKSQINSKIPFQIPKI